MAHHLPSRMEASQEGAGAPRQLQGQLGLPVPCWPVRIRCTAACTDEKRIVICRLRAPKDAPSVLGEAEAVLRKKVWTT